MPAAFSALPAALPLGQSSTTKGNLVNRREPNLCRRELLTVLGTATGLIALPAARAAELDGIALQPYFANVKRALEALASLGAPISPQDARRILSLSQSHDPNAVVTTEEILKRYTLAELVIEDYGSERITVGGAEKNLIEQGWRVFLLRVANPSGRTDGFDFGPGRYLPAAGVATMSRDRSSLAQRPELADTLNKAPLIAKLWIQTNLHEKRPLSGFSIEYRVIQVFSRDAGRRRSKFSLYTYRKSPSKFFPKLSQEFDFDCLPSRTVTLGVLDADGRGCVASLTIKDRHGHVYPLQVMRLAPDMAFQPHIYRGDGETMRLPDGEYSVKSKRGPEYLQGHQTVTINGQRSRINVQLKRWIDPAKWGWYSGDTHIHAAGCSHYQSPTEGVNPETMIRHARGEALTIAEVLTWGPSWYYQKQFFSGKAESPQAKLEHPQLQKANNATLEPRSTPKDSESLLRYDVEVSGFPSSLCGHLILLRLKEHDYPGTKVIEDWPSWNLPILKWAKSQGAVVGYAHCSSGMATDSKDLPNYEIPPFDGIGTNEAIIDVTHDLCDFLSGCNDEPVGALNAWYHMLNCGFRLVMAGETDYPCFSPPTDARPGMGRSYVQLPNRPTDDSGYDAWVNNLRQGRLYHGDGRSHFLKFSVNGASSGEEVRLPGVSTISIDALVAARLEPEPTPDSITEREEAPWHIEHARLGKSRDVPLELVVNGLPVERINFLADGTARTVRFKTSVKHSSWIALRILPTGHTHPVFVTVRDKPIRASRRSAQWCRQSVDKIWEEKSPHIRDSERPAAAQAFDHARRMYDAITAESEEP